MIVILEHDVKGLGGAGQVHEVKRGYAVNYLIPQGFAVAATKSRVLKLAEQMEAQKSLEAKLAEEAGNLQKEFSGKTFSLAKKVTKAGKLYGSVVEKDIVEVVKESTGHQITANNVKMEHLKELGEFTVTLQFSKDVSCEITVNVTAS